MKLTHEERHSALWMKLKEHLTQEIDRLRRKNDGELDEVTTSSIRGEIRALKKLVAAEEPPPKLADD